MKNKILLSLLVLLTFLIADSGWDIQKSLDLVPSSWTANQKRLFMRLFWYGFIPILFLGLIYGPRKILKELGLERGFIPASKIALVATLPMLIGYAFLAKGQINLTWSGFFYGALLAALLEEMLFRGFLFGQLLRFILYR